MNVKDKIIERLISLAEELGAHDPEGAADEALTAVLTTVEESLDTWEKQSLPRILDREVTPTDETSALMAEAVRVATRQYGLPQERAKAVINLAAQNLGMTQRV